ncbi:choice-of-anchor Q domain-containing protein [Flavimarina sp. Hel_I_48]|uniref:choice-of-anchor Q domain-containing protein n=1 Tax=Flavimarina sp. Hel_I_48 TaxID=1392488 RepID=UPI00068BB324|nr:choice-of-anchor Q domain-containing protein [Flavimarina sp. Hel_I_48]
MKQRTTLSNFIYCCLTCIAFTVVSHAQVVTSGADDGSDGTLRVEINDTPSGGTITFSVSSIDLNSEISIDKDLTITGDVTIDAGSNSRIFTISSGTTSLKDITLTNGMADNGGAVMVAGSELMLDNVTISNSIANGASGSGGAILVREGAKLTALNSSFQNNRANRAGGAIEGDYGDLLGISLTDTDFTGNNAGVAPATAAPGNGGAIHITGAGNITISGGVYKDNIASSEGGALWNGTGIMNIADVQILSNIASGNDADHGGGGVYNNGGTLNISEDTEFAGNIANGISGSGGALLSTAGAVSLTNVRAVGNVANRAGGAVEIVEGSLDMIMCKFTNNRFDTNNAAPGNGGALHVSGAATINILGGIYSGNRAARDGGAFWNQAGATMNLKDSVIVNQSTASGNMANNGGGGLYNNGGVVTMENGIQLFFNHASGSSGSGGGILSNGGTITMENTHIAENDANRAGAGIEMIDGTLNVITSSIRKNFFDKAAPGNGAGVHITGSTGVNFEGGNVWGNIATNEGGGLWNGSGTMTINGTEFYDNIAQGSTVADPLEIKGGGAIFANDNGILVINGDTNFHDNYATGNGGSGGGVLMAVNTSLTIKGTEGNPVVFTNNAANRAGGAIEDWSLDTSITKIDFTDFTGNSAGVSIDGFSATAAPGNGGAIHITGNGSIETNNTSANGNFAAAEGGAYWNSTGTMTVYTSMFSNNIASGDDSTNGGGALFNNGGTLNVWYSDIMNNKADGASGSGGGIQNVAGGNLTVNSTTISGNEAMRAGGGIEDNSSENIGTVRLMEVTLDDNSTASAPGNGGALHITGPGNSWIEGTTVSNNYASNQGGGLWNGAGTMDIRRSTISGNNTDGTGGGIYNLAGSLFANVVTIAFNDAGGIGGGIDTPEGSTSTLRNTIVAMNSASSGMDVANTGTYVSSDYNLIGQDDTDIFPAKSNDLVGTAESPVDPMLEALADNGGPTMTHALNQGSAAYNAGNPNDSDLDQRGEAVFGGRRDIGAFEAQMTLGVDDVIAASLSKSVLYPNPSRGGTVQLNIPATVTSKVNISIIEIGSGKTVLSQEGVSGINELNVNSLTTGTYIVRLVTGNTVESLKMVLGR